MLDGTCFSTLSNYFSGSQTTWGLVEVGNVFGVSTIYCCCKLIPGVGAYCMGFTPVVLGLTEVYLAGGGPTFYVVGSR